MKTLSAALFAVLLLAASVGTAVAAPGASGDHAKMYYLSLGDSLAASVQPIGDADDLFRTEEGYAEQLLAVGRETIPNLSLVKLGCPGETTRTMIDGGICSYAHGSQLDEAVAFLNAHRQFVAFITIDIGANDFPCQTAECVPAGFASIQSNLPVILSGLRAAAGADVPIVGMTIYNPFLAAWLLGPDGQLVAQQTAGLMAAVNGLLEAIFVGSGAATADVAGAFSSNDFGTLVPLPGIGDVPLNVARICQWTWVCAGPPLGPDNHANVAGYGVIAQAFATELGLG